PGVRVAAPLRPVVRPVRQRPGVPREAPAGRGPPRLFRLVLLCRARKVLTRDLAARGRPRRPGTSCSTGREFPSPVSGEPGAGREPRPGSPRVAVGRGRAVL